MEIMVIMTKTLMSVFEELKEEIKKLKTNHAQTPNELLFLNYMDDKIDQAKSKAEEMVLTKEEFEDVWHCAMNPDSNLHKSTERTKELKGKLKSLTKEREGKDE